jgi:LmbE family N-acetylglucosaminyl deacetylase
MKNILAIGAHPDDVEFGCAGTLAKHIHNGDHVTILDMTCTDCMNIRGEIIRQGERRRCEAEKAAKIIGAKLIVLDFKDQMVPFDRDSIFAIERILVDLNIDTIYTHWNDDSHQDHINTLKSVLSAARYVDNIFLYEQVPLPRVGKILSEVNYYIDISDFYKIKEEATLAHESQVKDKYNDKVILGMRSLAEFRGSQCNCKYAEAFEAVKQIIRN